MNREEFDKIIESTPEAKFKVIKDDEHCFSLDDVITFEGHYIEDDDDLLLLFNDGKDSQYLRLGQIELIAESVAQPLKLKFPCCIATSEIKDEETLKKVQDLFVASGATLEEQLWYTCTTWSYYGVDYDNETYFWDEVREYSATNSAAVTIYTLKDLFPDVAVETVVEVVCDDNPWIEWNGGCEPKDLPKNLELKFRDGGYATSTAPHYWRWEHYNDRDIVAYRVHKGTSVASQATTEPFKVVKHTYYGVTIKGEEYRFTKEEANLLCTLLVEAIGEDYEPI